MYRKYKNGLMTKSMASEVERTDLVPPVYKTERPVPIKALRNIKVLAAMDSGCSMVKFVYIDRRHFPDANTISEAVGDVKLSCISYPNTQIKEGIQWLMRHAQFTWPDQPAADEQLQFHVTGVGAASFGEMVQKAVNMNLKPVGEFDTVCNGAKFLMDHCCFANFLAPEPELNESEVECLEAASTDQTADIERCKTALRKNAALKGYELPDDLKPTKFYPTIFCLNGSNMALVQFDMSDSKMEMLGGSNATSGRVFMGMTRILTLLKDYVEINTAAEEGMVREPSLTNPDNFFRTMNDEEKRAKIESDPNLIAAGCVKMFTELVVGNLVDVCIQEGVINAVICGNTMRGSAFHRAYAHLKYMHKSWSLVRVQFIDCGESGAIGTMVDSLYSA